MELDSEALRLARAGVRQQILERVAGAERTPHRSAVAMNSALWTVTMGYYLNRMVAPVLEHYRQRYGTPENAGRAIENVREHFVGHVRRRGTAACHPGAGSDTLWCVTHYLSQALETTANTTDLAEGYLDKVLRDLQPVWQSQAAKIPRIARNPGDPDQDLLEVLGMDASAREVRLRKALGREFIWQLGICQPPDQ